MERIAAYAMSKFGLKSIPGSSSKGGAEALRKLIKAGKQGHHMAISLDGPKGPIYESKSGIIKVAQHTGYPILPLVLCCNKKFTFNSWDKMFLPLPFSKCYILVGDLMYIPKDSTREDLESYRNMLQNKMIQINTQAEELINPSI